MQSMYDPIEHNQHCIWRTVKMAVAVCTCNEERISKSDLRKHRLNRLKEGWSDNIFIVVKGISRHYGGPEEGGWWFDWHTNHEIICLNPKDCPGYPFWRLILNTIRRLKDEYPQPKRNRFSAANHGEEDFQIILCYDELQIPSETKHRPHYE